MFTFTETGTGLCNFDHSLARSNKNKIEKVKMIPKRKTIIRTLKGRN